MAKRRWSITEHTRNIHKITINLPRVGDEQYVLLQSDVHWDNPKTDWDTLRAHLNEAKERDAPIVDIGDFFCAMQGKYDQRSNKDDIRPEHQKAKYLDALVDTATSFLTPYKNLLTVRGDGNHETSILKRHETQLTERLVERLKGAGSTTVHKGGYSGFVVFDVVSNQTRKHPIRYHYHHGHGGGGPVTRGVIQTNRFAVYLADADIVHTGHTHDQWTMPISRIRLNGDNTEIVHTLQLHVRTPGYKQEFADGYGGWHIERGGPPKPIGAAWLRIRFTKNSYRSEVDYDVIEAK
jgi:hypothetical protein